MPQDGVASFWKVEIPSKMTVRAILRLKMELSTNSIKIFHYFYISTYIYTRTNMYKWFKNEVLTTVFKSKRQAKYNLQIAACTVIRMEGAV